MKIVVSGGREYGDRERVYEILDTIHRLHRITVLIHGAQRGADTLAKDWALSRGVPHLPFEVTDEEWNSYLGHRAGNRRNQKMLDEGQPEAGVIFPGNRGTRDMRLRLEMKDMQHVLVDDPVLGTCIRKGRTIVRQLAQPW